MTGKFVSGILGQLIIFLNNGNYSALIFYSLASKHTRIYRSYQTMNSTRTPTDFSGVTFAFVCIFFLPSIKREKNSHVVDDTAVKSEVFSKEVIRDPNILKYSAENVDQKKVNSLSIFLKIFFLYNIYNILLTKSWLQCILKESRNFSNKSVFFLFIFMLHTFILKSYDIYFSCSLPECTFGK